MYVSTFEYIAIWIVIVAHPFLNFFIVEKFSSQKDNFGR